MTDIAYKPPQGYDSAYSEDKASNTVKTRTESVVLYTLCNDNNTETLTVPSNIVVTGIYLTVNSSGTGSTAAIKLNSQTIFTHSGADKTTQYIPIPYWLIRKGEIFSITVPNDPAEVDTVYISIIGYYD